MKKSIFLVLFGVLAFTFAAHAQDADRYGSTRLNNLADQLKRQTVDLADRTSEELRRNNASRRDIEAAFLAHQLDASAGLFQQMVTDRRRAGDLRDAAGILTELARRAPNYGSNNFLWRDAQNTINDINREIGGGFGGGNNNGGNNQGNGRATWRGRVDNEVNLEIRGRNIITRTIAGSNYGDGIFNFSSDLPRDNVTVEVIKKGGRGDVRVIQQPRRQNNYTAIIQIRDTESGAREYELEIFWQ